MSVVYSHIPVLLKEAVDGLDVRPGRVYVDCTFGGGGYTREILGRAQCRVVGIDRDAGAVNRAMKDDRLQLVHDRFSNVRSILDGLGIPEVAGIVCDLGVSSMQIDDPERGFSFTRDGPLSMQMGSSQRSAEEVVNTYGAEELADVIYKYGEERFSRRIARAIVEARKEKPITGTLELAGIIARAAPSKTIHPATRTFQALRIYVNDELGELERLLEASLELLEPGGRIAAVSFHSLEDRIIKQFFNEHSGKTEGTSRYLPEIKGKPAQLKLVTKKPVAPGEGEVRDNVRARSAKLRVAEKL